MNTISIISVTYNDLNHLKPIVDLVRSQLRDGVEYIIIDGASKDGTGDYLQKLTDVRWVSEPDRGIYDAMNKGAHVSTGKWLLYLNAGDLLLPCTVQRLLAELNDDYDCYYGHVVLTIPIGERYTTRHSAPKMMSVS